MKMSSGLSVGSPKRTRTSCKSQFSIFLRSGLVYQLLSVTDTDDLSLPLRRRAQNAALLSNLFGIMIVMTVSGQYMVLYANDVIGLTPQKIAILLSLTPFISFMRLPAVPFIRRIGLVRTLQITRIGHAVIIGILFALPAAVLNLPLLLLLVLAFIFFRELGLGTTWQPLMRNITTTEDRGGFFARMRTSFSVVNLILSAAVAFFIGNQMQEYQYKVILGLAIFGSLNALFWTRRIPEPPPQKSPRLNSIQALRSIVKLVRGSPLFRLPLLITLIITMGQLPIGLVYFREGLNVPANLLALQIFFATLGQVISLLFWGKTSDTLGFRPMMAGLLWLTAAISLLLWLVPVFPQADLPIPELFQAYPLGVTILLLFGFGNGVLNAGLGIAATAVMHYHVDSRNSLVAMNVFGLFQLTTQAVLMLLMGGVIEHYVIPASSVSQPEVLFHFDGYKAYRGGLVPAAFLIAIPFVLRLPNLKPWFSVSDFFAVFRYNPVRSLLGNRHVYDEDESHRVQLARSLDDSPSPLNLQILHNLLRDPSYEVKLEAIRSLSRSKSPFAGKLLLDILEDPERRGLWHMAAYALGELRFREAVPTLIQCLDAEMPSRLRANAARALGKTGDLRAVEPILRALGKERDRYHVVASLTWALLYLKAEERADVAFESLLRLRDREERYELLSILSRWLQISDRWLLISDSETTAAKSLENYLTGFSPRWMETHRDTIESFQTRDFRKINQLLRNRLKLGGVHPEPVLTSLLTVLEEKAVDWSPLSVLATAWLLFDPDN